MKLKRPDFFKFAACGIMSLAFAHAVHAATVFSDNFDGSPVDAGLGYSYWDARNGDPTEWASSGNWWYNSSYDSTLRPTPRSGDQALHGFGQYNWNTLATTFQAGNRYSLSVWIQGDSDAVDETDSIWLYFYDGNNAPEPFSATNDFDTGSLYGVKFDAAGTTTESINTGGGSIGTFSGFNRSGGSEWSEAVIHFDVAPGDPFAGSPVGVALYGRPDAAFDDVTVSENIIPEPSTLSLLGIGLLGLIRRRRPSPNKCQDR